MGTGPGSAPPPSEPAGAGAGTIGSTATAGAAAAAGAGGRSVLEGAFALLAAVERTEEAVVTRLASECELPKSTAYRLLEQLADLGVLERCRGSYRVGPRMFSLGREWQPHPRLRSAAREPMRRLVEATGMAVGLSVLWRDETLVVEWSAGEAEHPVSLQPRTTWPWFTTAGKVLLAGAGPDPLLRPLPASWAWEAAAIRERGVAFDREEVMSGVCCAAVPLLGATGTPVSALCVLTDPAHHLERLGETCRQAGQVISAGLRGR
ncbi:IclR family transcriptional regulator [Streptomyces sp. NPDC127119]|uniref:IclR family transcriptional regulator n=1 Tax=Streptomyces sp. NPDC127119 TaxID=3345370 RepID=UPI0036455E57